MRYLFFLVAALVIPATVWANGAPAPAKSEDDQLAAALAEVERLKEKCEPAVLPKAKSRAVNRVRGSKGLNQQEKNEVLRMIADASCCDELRAAIKALDDRLTALERRVGVVEITAGNAQNTADEAKATADAALAEAKKKSAGDVVQTSSRVTVVTGTRLKLRVGPEIVGMTNFDYGLAFGTITGSMLFVTEEKWARRGEERQRLGFVLFGLDAALGLSFEKAIRQPLWATGGKVAWQWPVGLYLGVTGKTVAVGMNPTYHWLVGGGVLVGFSYPKPALQKPFGFFVEGWVGPAAHLANAPNWPEGWEPVMSGGLALGGQFL